MDRSDWPCATLTISQGEIDYVKSVVGTTSKWVWKLEDRVELGTEFWKWFKEDGEW